MSNKPIKRCANPALQVPTRESTDGLKSHPGSSYAPAFATRGPSRLHHQAARNREKKKLQPNDLKNAAFNPLTLAARGGRRPSKDRAPGVAYFCELRYSAAGGWGGGGNERRHM